MKTVLHRKMYYLQDYSFQRKQHFAQMAFYTSVKRWSVLVVRACHLVTSTHQWHYSLARVIQLGAVFIAIEIVSTAVSFFYILGKF